MPRYIDADELKDFVFRYGGNATVDDFIKWIEQTETADVVEVVRCKDCKYYNTYESHEKINDGDKLYDGWCMRWSGIEDMNDDDFCSYGKSKL